MRYVIRRFAVDVTKFCRHCEPGLHRKQRFLLETKSPIVCRKKRTPQHENSKAYVRQPSNTRVRRNISVHLQRQLPQL